MGIRQRFHVRCGCAAAVEAGGSARPFAFAGTPRVFERDRPFTVRHLALELVLDIAQRGVRGTATLDIARVDASATELALDAVGFELSAVTVAGKSARFSYDGRVVRIAMPSRETSETTQVAVTYSARPRKGLYFLEPDEHVKDRPRQVWSQCQEEDARHWFPCIDRPHVKMTTELAVTVPAGWTALSNGALVDRQTPPVSGGAETWRWHWRMDQPHSSYLVTLATGEFSELEEPGEPGASGDIPITYFVPRGREDDGRRTFGRTPEMLRYFGELFGVKYPWNKYAQIVVSDFTFGGMENTTATTMYHDILLDERAALDATSDDLVAHELAHQWFGDYVTCRDWSEGWLNEGFATYLEHVWLEHHLGLDEYHVGLKEDLAAYLSEAHGRYRRPIVCQDYDAPLDLFDHHLYEKGGLVLHALRVELGKDTFWRGVSVYLQRHAGGIVETRDLLRALEEVSGKSLGRFFEQWVWKPGHPELEVTLTWDAGILTVATRQQQAATDGVPSVFELALDLEFAGGHTESVLLTQRAETFALRVPERPAFVVVDPHMRVLGDLTVKAPSDMLRAQLAGAPTARGRWLAAGALARGDEPPSLDALAAQLSNEREFWAVRAECAEALARVRSPEGFEALVRAASTDHPKVRRAAVAALGSYRTAAALEALRPHALRDASWLVEAEATRALGRTRREGAFEVLLDVLNRPSWAATLESAAADGLAALRDERAVPHLLARTRYGHADRSRRAAVMALPKVTSDRKTRESIEDLLEDSSPHLRLDAVRALAELGDVRARSALRTRLDLELDVRVKRRIRETLRDLGPEAGRQATRELRDELEKASGELGELRARLAKLEARTAEPLKTTKMPPTPPPRALKTSTKAPKKLLKRPKKRA